MTATTTDPAPGPIDRLLDLRRAGTLAAEYPRLRGLLADVSEPELQQAGRVLSRLDPDDVVQAHPDTPQLTVAITGHGTLNQLVPSLAAELARHGLLLRPALSDFDSYVFDLSDPDSPLYAADPDLTLCLLDPTVVFDEVAVPWRPDDVARVLAEKVALIERLVDRFAETARGTLVLNTIPLPPSWLGRLVDHRSRARLSAHWYDANAALLRLAETQPKVVVLDTNALLAEGIPAVDQRLAGYAKVQLSPDLLARYAREVGHLARHVTGRTKKILALDLDGTLWGGVLGDDGIEGIEVADTYRGEAFRAVQQLVLQLGDQGVLITAVSKNDLDTVRAALRDHPRQTLREADFVRITANWRPKHDNLVELAADLNLGVDSIVFVDDSPYECGLVRSELPEVAVVQLDTEPTYHVDRILADGWFDVADTTVEDRKRPARYREDLDRKDFLSSFDSVQDYLRQLDVEVRIAPAAESEIERISQITLRTNQFNLTTRRLQPAEVRTRTEDPDNLVVTVHTADRFGDNGLVGTVLARRDGPTVRIDNFLLSCRVFSRGIEQTVLSAVLSHAKTTGATEVVGQYRPTPKNAKVRDFYARNGFTAVTDDGDTAVFRHDLSEIPPPPEHVRLTDNLRRATS